VDFSNSNPIVDRGLVRLLILTIAGLLVPTWLGAADQAIVDQGLQWIQQQGAPDSGTLQQRVNGAMGSLCQGCDPQTQTQGLQGLRQDPAGLTQQGVNAFQTDPTAQSIKQFQRTPPLDPQNQFVVTGNAIISAQTGITDGGANPSCLLRTPTATHVCQAGYGQELSDSRVEQLVLDNIVPPQATAQSAANTWQCGSSTSGSSGSSTLFGSAGSSFFLTYCYYRFEVVRYTGTGIVLAGVAGTYTQLLTTPISPIQVTVPEGQPFSVTIHDGSTTPGSTLLPLVVTGETRNGAGTATFSDGRETITLPIRYGTATATERWVSESGELDESCEVVATTCTDGPSTKYFAATAPPDGNSYPFTRDCWAREITFSCRGQYFDTCGAYRQDPSCQQVSATCLEQDSQGCRRAEETWACGGVCKTYQRQSTSEFDATIPGVTDSGLLIGTALSKLAVTQALYQSLEKDGTCDCRAKETAYTNAQAALNANPNDLATQNAALQAQRDYEGCLAEQCADALEDPSGLLTVFRGTGYSCKRNMVGCNECACKGLCSTFGLCDKNDKKSFISRKEKGLCHHVGDVKKKKLLALSEVIGKYCCFNSKLARIIHEQGRPQLGWGWGTPESPDCGPFTLNEGDPHYFGRLDFSRMDLSEYINDLRLSLPDQQQLTDRLKQGVNRVAP
jgi:hypothetical protein